MGRVVSLELRRSTNVTGGWSLTKSWGMLVVCVPGALGYMGRLQGVELWVKRTGVYRLAWLTLKNLVY